MSRPMYSAAFEKRRIVARERRAWLVPFERIPAVDRPPPARRGPALRAIPMEEVALRLVARGRT